MGRMTWEEAPKWAKELGKHHSEALRNAVIALHRNNVDFRQTVLRHGEVRHEVDRDTAVAWNYNIQDLAEAGEETVNLQLAAQRAHEAYLETLTRHQLAAVRSHGEVRGANGVIALRDVLPKGALPPQIRRVARLLSRSEVEAAIRELNVPEVAAQHWLVPLGRTTTAGELRQSVRAAVAAHDAEQARRVTSDGAWDRVGVTTSWFRVRAAGDRILLSPSRCGSLPGDRLLDSDLLCAADACAIVRNLSAPLEPLITGVANLFIPHGTLLNEAARLLRGAVLASELAAPLLDVVAAKLDATEGQTIAAALRRAVAPTTQHGSRTQTADWWETLSQIASRFGVHIYRPLGGFMEYSDVNAAALRISQIPRAPKCALREDASGYVHVRHDNSVVPARADGECAGEALHFASGCKFVGDAVQAAPRQSYSGVGFGDISRAITPLGYRLQRIRGFEDGSQLFFTDLFRANMHGIAVCETVAQTRNGKLETHYVVADFWRRLVFLGAGELSLQWLAGIIGVRGDDREFLDERLRELRIQTLVRVRMLWVQSERVRAKGHRPGRNGWARQKRKREGPL